MKEAKNTSPRPTLHAYQRRTKWGIFLIIAPFVLLFGVLFLHSITAFVAQSLVATPSIGASGLGEPSAAQMIISLIRVMLGLLGIIGVIGIVVGLPVGIILLATRREPEGAHYDHRSGKGGASEVPNEIQRWNWGAAGLTFVWGIANSAWFALLTLVPFLGLVWWIVAGMKGNEWAWRGQRWESVDAFLAHQRKWKPWGITFLVLWVLLTLVMMFPRLFLSMTR